MQLSAANLIIASQQLARSAKPQADGPQFARALAKEQGAKEAVAFEAIDFKPAAPPAKPAAATPAQTPVASYGAAKPLGGNLDIRV